jgi:hypothetical protein
MFDENTDEEYEKGTVKLKNMPRISSQSSATFKTTKNQSSPTASGDENEDIADEDNFDEERINYKVTLARPIRFQNRPAETVAPPSRKAKYRYPYDHHERTMFRPCNHEGSCEDAKCRCWRKKITCEKSCACSPTCPRRYPGCSCSQRYKGRPCGELSQCECRKRNRECDVDLCGSCGVAEVLDPISRNSIEELKRVCCSNCDIQIGRPKRTLMGKSDTHGFGIFMGESARKGDFLGEYTGQILGNGETDRRFEIQPYDLTYFFILNKSKQQHFVSCLNCH